MARPVSTTFATKVARVREAVVLARGADRRHFDFSSEVQPGVRLVLTELGGEPLALSLWSLPQDVAELCSDASVPATEALLAIDGADARDLIAGGHTIDLAQFTRSQSFPDLYYTLFDRASERRIHSALHRLIPALEPHAAAA